VAVRVGRCTARAKEGGLVYDRSRSRVVEGVFGAEWGGVDGE